MQEFAELIAVLRSLASGRSPLLVGMDGLAGSGKSTLARQLQGRPPELTIVPLDAFYAPELDRADWQRLDNEVLQPLKAGRQATYRRYDWGRRMLVSGDTVEPRGIVLVEGVFTLGAALADRFDYRIWVECPPAVCLERGLRRDGARFQEKWTRDWMPGMLRYVDTEHPQTRADLVVDYSQITPPAERHRGSG